eukprot:CAMPEP_0198294850 /NCGR_PEP_ID=MMETSP1449-20131203/24681_1 /TAXON_ID=420275 /ORGANISM="Attheya septentrionalis, Strain CCMP2084" /LENGTH=454 /DNA_ID=CAMNT_0043994945 /DNA_START=86 /DNA_END=1450 /DNA_ORIENTATION=+
MAATKNSMLGVLALAVLGSQCEVDAFTTSGRAAKASFARSPRTTATASALSMSATGGFDPFHLEALGSTMQDPSAVKDALSAFLVASADDTLMDAAASAATVAADGVPVDAVDAAASTGGFGFLTGPIEGLLFIIHNTLVSVGLDANAWGLSIILITIIIKGLTFPLTKSQLEGTNKMQALQPKIKEIQAKYESNPEVMNQKVAEIYKDNEVNPLAGCLPSIVQIPVFIGLYRAVLALAKDNELNEPFLWLPNLEGPTYGAEPAQGSDWILKGWVDGVPTLGWEDTLLFLSLPIFLVISQAISMQLMQPKSDDAQQQQANVILKFLPLMIGWFSLNVPAALCIYWVVNNVVTTATTLIVRNSMKVEPIISSSSGSAVAAPPPASTGPFSAPPSRDRPQGFTSSSEKSSGGVTPITAIDAEIVTPSAPADEDNETSSSSPPKNKKRGGKKKKGKK